MKAFTPDAESCYDLSNYSGRFFHFQKLINPFNMFTPTATMQKYQQIMQDYKNGNAVGHKYTDQELWEMKYILLANTHPETQQPINPCFRLSGFVPTNIPIVIGLAILPATPMNQFLAQSINQTYNFAFNYANRNASNTFTNTQLLGSYLAAVSFACGFSIGTSKVAQRLKINQMLKNIIVKIAPFIGVASANLFNLSFSRFKDFSSGISVQDDETGEFIDQKSQKAARIAFIQSSAMRLLVPVGIFVIPGMCYAAATRLNVLPTRKISKILFDAGASALTLYVGLAGSIALYPQIVRVHKSRLEPYFQNLKNSKGNPIEVYQFNKGV